MFVLFVEIYVGLPFFVDKLISTNLVIELFEALMNIPVIAYLQSN